MNKYLINNCYQFLQIENTYFEEYPNSSLLTELGETIEAISVNDISFSPSPIKSFKIPNNPENSSLELKTIKVKKKGKVKKYQRLNKTNNLDSKHDRKSIEQKDTSAELKNINIESCENEILNLEAQGIQAITGLQSNNIVMSPTKDKTKFSDEYEVNTLEKILSTPPSFGSNRSFDYSRWIRKESIRKFINRYIPRFLLPAFKAIERLRIRLAIPTKSVDNRREIKQKKEKVRKMLKK